MSGRGARLPYPGLRSFTREETDLFFGREGCVDAMVDRLAATRFLAVLGASGSGKSSLVRTGLLDALELGLLPAAGSRWMIADFRPGDRPIQSMAEGLIRAASADPSRPPDEEEVRLLRAYLARGPRSIAEWCAAGHLPDGTNLLILVDQFEELFRYSDYGEREEAEAFVALLLESARAPLAEARIYVTITMRSEFLGAAALIDGLAEAINRGLYLTPRMSREEVRQAITGPAAVCGATIEPALVNRLLNDLTSFAPWDEEDSGNQLERLVRRADQLPLMQHVLNRLYSLAAARGGGAIELKLEDYEALGGLRGALAAHGGEILDELLPEHKQIAASVFRALAAGTSLAEAVRRPTEFGELVEIAGGDERGVREVVEAFRAPGRNFLMPPRPARLRPETVIDISHESLVRQWDQFAAWLQDEIAAAAAWRRLSDTAERHERGEANLLSGLALASLANSWDNEQPTPAWAKRYGGDFEKAASFLELSKREEARGRRDKLRSRFALLAALLLVVVVIPVGWYLWEARRNALEAKAEAEAAQLTAEAERQKAIDAAVDADSARRLAESERQKALDEAARADAAARAAEEAGDRAVASATAAAEAERQLAIEAAARAEEERRRALDAAAAAARFQEERERALAAAKRAGEEKLRADQERQNALAAAAVAQMERDRAEQERRKAEEAAAFAQSEKERADQERQNAEAVRAQFREANLELVGNRVWSLQREGSWDQAADLLSALWQLVDRRGEFRAGWLIEPVRAAFRLQSLAEYPVTADFLDYSGFEGWSGRSGRFRVYSLAHRSDAGEGQGNNLIGIFDAVTGSVVGRFELPAGKDLGSERDLVAPEGERVAIITADGLLALWSRDMQQPVLMPVPAAEGSAVKVDQLAQVSTDARFALLLARDSEPSDIVVIDPAGQAALFTLAVADLARRAQVEAFGSVELLGLVDGRLILGVDQPVGRVIAVEIATGAVRDLDAGGEVKSTLLTPDGRILLALTCPTNCSDQDLVALDTATGDPLWVDKLPLHLGLNEDAVHWDVVDGELAYTALAENEGQGLLIRFGTDRSAPTILDARSHPRIGETTFDGNGSYRLFDTTNADGSANAGALALYAMPETRQKLDLYVDRNSVALFDSGGTQRVAGITRDGDLLVYRSTGDGAFETDPAFRPLGVGGSSCIGAIAFGGDGRSLLIRRIDGALRHVTEIGGGPGVGWTNVLSDRGMDAGASMQPAPEEIDCDTEAAGDDDESEAEASLEKLVAADSVGRQFALLDMQGDVWGISVLDSDAGEAGNAGLERVIALPERIGTSARWIAADPQRGRIAMVSPSAVEVPPWPAPTGTTAQGDGSGRDASAGDGAGAATPAARAGSRSQRLPRRGEAKAAAFDSDGTLLVAYAGGLLARFRLANGAWSVAGETAIPNVPVRALAAGGGRAVVSDDRDFSVLVEGLGAGAIARYGRLPGKPSATMLLPEGHVLTVEYNTDSVATFALSGLPEPAQATDTARLVAMRSRTDEVEDSSIDALLIDRNMEAPAAEASASSCDTLVGFDLARMEGRILAGEPVNIGAAPDCAAGRAALAAARSFAGRNADAAVTDMLEDPAFSELLRLAAEGDAAATRILGAVLARIAGLRGHADEAALAEDALRFGTGLPRSYLMNAASGAPIGAAIAEAAANRSGIEPTAHQLLAHALERSIGDIDDLSEALFEFALAERFFTESGRLEEAHYCGHRRAALARILPDERVLDIWQKLQDWRPEAEPIEIGEVATETAPEPLEGHAADMRNLERLVERLPGSPLLEGLRTELRRAAILADLDPRAAAESLLKLSGSGAGWSPDLVEEYLALATDLGDRGDTENAFRLAAAAVKAVDGAFGGPIHANGEAAGLFRRAAEMMASTAASVPAETVAAETGDLALRLAQYDYSTLPGKDKQPDTSIGESVLDSAAKLAAALAAASGDAPRWASLQGTALFWRGVLINDHDQPKAVDVMRASAQAMRGALDKAPTDDAARFRYAEALRWIGISAPSTPETAETEREAVRQYRMLWEHRSSFGRDLLSDVGVGYGFGLSNLARTVREMNLADLEDGRGAEEHAEWVLELLTLAAEKDAVNATLIAMGAGSSDFDFARGRYRMLSYGFPTGFLSGLVHLENANSVVTRCDVLASDPYDAGRRAPGRLVADVASEAEAACSAAHQADPTEPRATFQLARAMSRLTNRRPQFMPLAVQAAESGVAAAFVLIAETLEEKKDDRSEQAYAAAAQRALIESFPGLYPYLESRAADDDDRKGLGWYAEKAAALGVPEAHLALAGLSDDPVARQVHLALAARIWTESGNPAAANMALGQAVADLGGVQVEEVEARVAGWKPEDLIGLPEDVGNM